MGADATEAWDVVDAAAAKGLAAEATETWDAGAGFLTGAAGTGAGLTGAAGGARALLVAGFAGANELCRRGVLDRSLVLGCGHC